ncbi:hypothetical protein PFFCH_04855 [Plasmodium falciparum FCH/4]|uniref:t-SNARE coiled-coil homology domain-containing protein n=1 Tax=Plasmodium falciparum FCH/4 TaxID=1036724 RepID=A0A024VHP8_PLAFA|nr:hypothetical protein PFFCH_04855 [Plasmodium falciparum FCH/4]
MPYVDKTEEFFKIIEKLSNDNINIRKNRSIVQDTQVGELASKITDLLQSGYQNGQQQVLKQPSKHSYLHSRADAMENIQKVIGDLAQMFQKVATMVTQQDEMIKRIDEDIDISLTNTREGQNYLLTYFNRLTSTRTLILQVLIWGKKKKIKKKKIVYMDT